jgi:hypothetical protein
MILKSFGCSFIFGNDLSDVIVHLGEPYSPPSKTTWPALLAKDLGCEYQCHARPGSGNLRILEKILTQANASTPDDLFVIGWSWIDRFDYTITLVGQAHLYDIAGDQVWHTVMPIDSSNKAKVYYKDLHSEFRDKFTTLINIKTAIDVLKQKNIPFVMTYIDDLIFEDRWNTNTAIADLQAYIQPYMTTFQGLSFLDWSKQQNFEISDTLHPLETAHQAGFEMIKSYNLPALSRKQQ